METTIRGIIEKHIDRMTQPKNLEIVAMSFERFPIKSMEDCLFGFVVGSAVYQYSFLTESVGKPLTEDEATEFWDIIERRTMEIRGKIKLALGK